MATDTPSFNPLNANSFPPEACGYGIRELKLSTNLISLKFSTLQRKKDVTVKVSDIVRVIIPQSTSEIVKVIRGDPE